MVLNKLIEVTVTSNTKKHYNSLGINCKRGDKILVLPDQLLNNSMAIETRICDCCKKQYETSHQAMLISHKRFGSDYCADCVKNDPEIKQKIIDKRKNTNIKKYGATAPCCNKDIQNKVEQTNLTKYGVKSTLSIKEVRDKIAKTNLERYGYENAIKNKEVRAKIEQTNLERYGAKNPMQNIDIYNKTVQTNLEKYGVKSTAEIPEVREKMVSAMYLNGNIPSSKKQLAVFNMIRDAYPDAEIEYNSPLSSLSLDIKVIINNIPIDVEYDGWYWHRDKYKDFARDKVVQSFGYKVLRIQSGNKIPSKEELISSIELLLNSDKKFNNITLSD